MTSLLSRAWRQRLGTCLLAFAAWASTAHASGGGEIEDVFHRSSHPDMPAALFVEHLGSLRKDLRSPYLVVWYWRLQGHPLSAQRAQEVAAALESFQGDPPRATDAAQQAWRDAASQARAALRPPPAATGASAPATRAPAWNPETLSSGLGCYEDAYRQATRTLAQRRSDHGDEPLELLHWLSTQEAVFSHCEAQTPDALPALPAKAPTWLRQDHAYQAAAARFYAGDYGAAEAQFAAIARDAASPWRLLARYMALRILARQSPAPDEAGASTSPPSPAERKQLDTQTRRLSNALLADASLAPWHASVVRIRESLLLRYRAPQERLQVLSDQLGTPEDAATAARLALLAQASRACYWSNCVHQPGATGSAGGDLLAWLRVMLNQPEQRPDGVSRPLHETAWQHYQQRQSLAWLLASAAHMPANDERQKVLQAALAQVPPKHPAAHAARMLRAQWAIAQGRSAEARPLVLPLLESAVAKASPTERNDIKALLLPSAQSLAEWQQFATRQRVGLRDPEAEESPALATGLDLLDADGRRSLAQQLPLSSWLTVSQRWEPAFRREFLQSAWTRAVLTQRFATARTVAAQWTALPPEPPIPALGAASAASAAGAPPPAPQLARSAQLGDDDALGWRRLLLARLIDPRDVLASPLPGGPGFNNGGGYGKWCLAHEPNGPASDYNPAQPLLPAATFLTPAERSEWQAEQEALRALPPDSVYFTQQALALMAQSPQDPLVPEALSVAVRMARYTCKSPLTQEWSRKGWQALHKHYPNSAAAARTKYWY